MTQMYAHQKALDLKALCILPKEYCWKLNIDISVCILFFEKVINDVDLSTNIHEFFL